MKIFVDTWGWVAIADENDAYHSEALNIYENNIIVEGNDIVTTILF